MELCGLHSLNNALQKQIFVASDLIKLGDYLYQRELVIRDHHIDNEYYNSTGNFNISVIEQAIINKGMQLVTMIASDNWLNTSQLPVGIYIIGTGTHWFTIIKFQTNELAWNLDSLIQIPEQITNLATIIKNDVTGRFHNIFKVIVPGSIQVDISTRTETGSGISIRPILYNSPPVTPQTTNSSSTTQLICKTF